MKKIISITVLLFTVLIANSSHSQTIINYERTTFSGTYQEVTGTPGPGGDDYAENYLLPFPFYYIDHTYDQVRICTNGWIELGSTARPLSFSSSLSNEDLFSNFEPNKTLAPWWDDIGAFNFPVEYATLGSSPNRVFVVQWREINSPYFSPRLINFQVRLYESTNIIEFWYGGVSGSGDIEFASFGIEDDIGGSGHFIDGPTGSNTVGTIDLNSYNNWPTLFYRFSPSPVSVVRPNGGEFFSIGFVDTIKWMSTVTNVRLEYSTNSGTDWSVIENSVPASTGKYPWLVPNTPSENSLVRISDASNLSVFDISNNVFTISFPPVITVQPDSFYFLLNEGDSTESVMQILNSGLGNLFYEISIENVSDRSKENSNTSPYNSSAQWRENFLDGQKHRVKNFQRNYSVNNFPEGTLPLIISDPTGDGGPVDIIQIRGRSTVDSIQMEFVFDTELNPFDFGGYLGLDADQDIFTGQPLPFGLSGQEVGCEYFVELYAIGSNIISIYDQFFNYLGSFPAEYDLRSFRFSIPLLTLGNDDGIMNLAAVVGNGAGPTDWIPDMGYGVLGGNRWLSVEPLSGTILPGSNENINVKVVTNYIDGGEYYANILISSNDPVNQLVTIPVHLTVIGQPNLVAPDSVDFGEVYIGYPEIITADLLNNGSVTLQVSDIQSSNLYFHVQGPMSFSINPNETYSLPILFDPVNPTIETGTLTIMSNDPSSPSVINLTGEGIHPPVISVTPDSFFYDLNVGDSIVTSLAIENSGLGELNFQISDRQVQGRIFTEPTHQYHQSINPQSENLNFFGIDLSNYPTAITNEVFNYELQTLIDNDNSMSLLPLIIPDVIGDGGIADIKEIRGRIFNDNLDIEFVFADGIIITDSTLAVLCLDTDRNPATGAIDPFYYHDLGVDYFLEYFPLAFGNQIVIVESSTGNQNNVPYVINGTTISYSVPLSFLGNDDGEMDLLAVAGYEGLSEYDWAPDTGHATLLADAFWLSEIPTSGTIPPGGNISIEIQANTSNLIGGNYLAMIDISNNDPSSPIVEVPFAMHLTGIAQIDVSPGELNFGQTNIGYYESLFFTISSTGTDSLFGNIISSHPQFVLIDSTFSLPVGGIKLVEVQFYPLVTGPYSGHLTINSNATSVPINVPMTGEGVVAPNIITNTNSMQFEVGAGETLESNFVIYNTGGADLQVEIYDEAIQRSTSSSRLFAAGQSMIYEIDPDNGNILNSFNSPVLTSEGPTGLAFSGDKIFFTDSYTDYFIYVLDPDNGNVTRSFATPTIYIDGLAFIDPYLYAMDYSLGYICVLDPVNGNLLNTLYPPVLIWGGIDGGNDRLFASSDINIYELNPSDGTLINSFSTNFTIYGVGFTGERLFTSLPGSGIDEYDPDTGQFIRTLSSTGYAALAGGGNPDAEWLIENPTQVTISGGDSSTINLQITAPTVLGHYSALIILESNDPDSSYAAIQVELDVVTGVDDENTLPTVYSLYNNFPNPFNPATTISYDLPKQSVVSLKVYNIVGEEITTLVNAEQNAGRYKIDWNASQFASGVYFYRIQAAEFVDVKKMILMK